MCATDSYLSSCIIHLHGTCSGLDTQILLHAKYVTTAVPDSDTVDLYLPSTLKNRARFTAICEDRVVDCTFMVKEKLCRNPAIPVIVRYTVSMCSLSVYITVNVNACQN